MRRRRRPDLLLSLQPAQRECADQLQRTRATFGERIRYQNRSIRIVAEFLDTARFVHRPPDHREVQPPAGPDIAVDDLTEVQGEVDVQLRQLIADIFSNAMRDGQIRSIDARFAAEQFLYAVVDGPARTAVLSGKIARTEKDFRERVTAAVGLLPDGCRDGTAKRS